MSTSISAPKLFIAVPIYGGGKTGFWLSTLNLLMRPRFHMELRCNQGDSLVPRSRNELTAEFLKTDCTHLFFVDSDIVYDPENVKTLLDHNEDVIAGYYPKRLASETIQWVCNEFEEPEKVDTAGKKKMRMMGTGFMLIKRCVFEKILAEMGEEIWFTKDQSDERQWDFWPIGVWKYPDGIRRYLSEDWYFCERWRAMGGNIMGDTMTTVRHIGEAEFPMDMQIEPRNDESNEIQDRLNRARRMEAQKLFDTIKDWSAIKEYAARKMEACRSEAMGIDTMGPGALAHLARCQGRHEELKNIFRLDLDVEKRLKTEPQ